MTAIHAQIVGDKVILPRAELEHLVALAQQNAEVSLHLVNDALPIEGLMTLAEQGGVFDWLGEEEELYTVDDGKQLDRHGI